MEHSAVNAINLIVSTLACIWVTGVVAVYALFRKAPNIIIRQETSGQRSLTGAGWGLTFWGVWWLSLAAVYALLAGYSGNSLAVLLWPNDLGNLAALAGALAYSRGKEFKKRDLLPFLLIGLLLPVVASSVTWLIPGLTGRMVAVAPSAVISTVAIIAMGWSILVRCGWGTSPFLLVVGIYACLQVPAYVDAMVLRGSTVEADFTGVTNIFYILAFFKIVVGLSFLGYFLSPGHTIEALKEEKLWPSDDANIPMNRQYLSVLRWGAGLIGAVIVGFVIQLSSPQITTSIFNVLQRIRPGGR